MLSSRYASQLAPLVLRNGARTAFARNIRIGRQLPAIAILVPRQAYATETSTHSSDGNFPPPGFNAEQAKKPLPKDQQTKQAKKADGSKAPDVNIPAAQPTEHPPTSAAESHATTQMAADKSATDKQDEKKLARKKEEKKSLTIRQRVMKEVHHYWDGTKLLATEVKISSRLALKMAAGYELT
ncbi:LETM1 domain-containing protein ylh47, partial [Oleoguttula sp. CCFEE 5521]